MKKNKILIIGDFDFVCINICTFLKKNFNLDNIFSLDNSNKVYLKHNLQIFKLNKLSDYKINLYELSKLKYNLDDIVIQMVQCLREKINPRLRVLNK
jgi:hypothetical protein